MPLTDHNSAEPADELPVQAVHPAGSVFVSLLFWCSLTIAAAAYAAVALSPKFIEWISVRQQFRDNALHLQKLEEEVVYLERVADALRTDPVFASQIAESTGTPAAVTPSADTSPTAATAAFAPDGNNLNTTGAATANAPVDASTMATPPLPPLLSPESLALIRKLATSATLRNQLLCGAAALTLLAFTLFNEAGGWLVMTTLSQSLRMAGALFRRYSAPIASMTTAPADTDTTDQATTT